jgi:hypothetical protein
VAAGRWALQSGRTRSRCARTDQWPGGAVSGAGHDWTACGHDRALVEGRSGASQLKRLARLLNRVIDLNLEHCPNCGGELKAIAAILETAVRRTSGDSAGVDGALPWGSQTDPVPSKPQCP